MMVDNNLSELPNEVTLSVNDMQAFPDSTSQAGTGDKQLGPDGAGGTDNYTASDGDGYLLYQHDIIADNDAATDLVNYVATRYTTKYYTVDKLGTISQFDTAGES